MEINARFATAAAMAEEYENFVDFAIDAMEFLGFDLTEVQADIADFMQCGPRLRMVMAQRGEAKSTLAALYAVWRIIQKPSTRVLIVSGGEKQASEVATLVVRIITTWDILEYLRPDRRLGDRTSTEAFDIHYALKGIDKSPSVACVGITSNLPGKRADLLIPDDIETNKNGLTATQRDLLMHLSKEFSSICQFGDILYLGTPQSKDSIYNTLPGRGFTTRIWPGRYPTNDELANYGDRLAPLIANRLKADSSLQTGGGLDGKRGKPTDPALFNEATLVEKELDKGPEDFQLQYMLDTTLADALRQQLKLSDLVVANFASDMIPEIVAWQAAPKYQVELGNDFTGGVSTKMYYAVPLDCAFVPAPEGFMFIDPAGGGADEIGFGVACSIGPYVHVLDAGGLKGGLTDENGAELAKVIRACNVKRIKVESNMGHGLFEINLRALLAKLDITDVAISGEYSSGQKERRIIDSLVSPMQRHRVIVHQQVFDSDIQYCKQHSMEVRTQYSLWYQMANITTDRNSLPHDDRVEAVAGAVREFKAVLALDENKAAEARKTAASKEFLDNPMGRPMESKTSAKGTRAFMHQRRRR